MFAVAKSIPFVVYPLYTDSNPTSTSLKRKVKRKVIAHFASCRYRTLHLHMRDGLEVAVCGAVEAKPMEERNARCSLVATPGMENVARR
jgi:hypothetical protein